MRIVFLNGSEFRGDGRDFIRALWHPLFVGQVLVMTSILLLVRPYDQFMPDAVMLRSLIVSSAVLVFVMSVAFVLSQSARWPVMGLTSVAMILAVTVASLWGVAISVLAGGALRGPAEWLQLLVFNIIFSTLGEIFLSSFLLKRIAQDTGMKAYPIVAYAEAARAAEQETQAVDAAETDSAAQSRWVEILGQKLPWAEIGHLKAEEHYVSVRLRDGTSMLLRGRLLDAIEQLPQNAGMQVHRSHWVACSVLDGLSCAREGCRLRLLDGQEVPIARNRRVEVRTWARALLLEARFEQPSLQDAGLEKV